MSHVILEIGGIKYAFHKNPINKIIGSVVLIKETNTQCTLSIWHGKRLDYKIYKPMEYVIEVLNSESQNVINLLIDSKVPAKDIVSLLTAAAV